MMKRAILVIIMMISTFGFYSFTVENDTDDVKTGVASYYHDKFNGRKTANGEIFDNEEFTAASRHLPFGTVVKVTNIRNGKSVEVRINDRGPFHKNRALDLSKAAFEEIGDTKKGHMPVEYEIID